MMQPMTRGLVPVLCYLIITAALSECYPISQDGEYKAITVAAKKNSSLIFNNAPPTGTFTIWCRFSTNHGILPTI